MINSAAYYADLVRRIREFDYGGRPVTANLFTEAAIAIERLSAWAKKDYCRNCHCESCRPECHGIRAPQVAATGTMDRPVADEPPRLEGSPMRAHSGESATARIVGTPDCPLCWRTVAERDTCTDPKCMKGLR